MRQNADPTPGCYHSPRLVALDPATGTVLLDPTSGQPWNPGICCVYQGVWALMTDANGTALHVGGEFKKAGGTWTLNGTTGVWEIHGFAKQQFYARFSDPPGTLTDDDAGAHDAAEPEDGWLKVLALEDLPEGRATRAMFEDTPVMLYRSGERIFAIGARCTHQGAPLDRGPVKVGGSLATVTCPAHGSMFSLDDGSVMRGPATQPVPAYHIRVVSGNIELQV